MGCVKLQTPPRAHRDRIALAPQAPSAHVPALTMTLNTAPSQEKLGDCTQPVPEYRMTLVLDKIAVFMEEPTGTSNLKGVS